MKFIEYLRLNLIGDRTFVQSQPSERVFILSLLDHAAFYEDETRYGVCPYADQRWKS